MQFRTNIQQLVMQSVLGEIVDPPVNASSPYRVSADGEAIFLPATGGITYNFRIGDSAIDIWGDHIEPAVTIRNPDKDKLSPSNGGLNMLSCIGNRAFVVSGSAKGEVGRVTGTHGGIEHTIIDFTREQMETMTIGDRIQVRAFGVGLKLLDYPLIHAYNIDPALLPVMHLADGGSGNLKIGVTHIIPAALMGSGLGHNHTHSGDYDIQMFDPETVESCRLNTLRFGDIVAITDTDHTYGRIYRQKSVSVGVIIHSRSIVAGHGPGVTTLFTSTEGAIQPFNEPEANLKNYFQLLDNN